MKATPIFYGTVNSQGSFVPHNKVGLRKWLSTLAGKRAQLVIEKEKKSRTVKQNAWYWSDGGPLAILSDCTGFTKEEAHEFFKVKFLKRGVDFKGERYEITRSTTSLSPAEFGEYVEKCCQLIAEEFQVAVPLPGEVAIDINIIRQ